MNESNHSLVLFDGVCNFCNSTVNFIIRHDRKDHFRFAPLQSITGEEMLLRYHIDRENTDSFILIENGRAYVRSAAGLRISRRLNGAWPVFYGFMIVPRFIRDFFYNIIAKNRYRWWGKRESCMIPDERVRKKFLS